MNEKPKDKIKSSRFNVGKMLQSVLDGSFLTRRNVVRYIPLYIYVLVLLSLSISISYRAEKKVRRTVHLKEENKELRYKYIEMKRSLNQVTKQSYLAQNLKNRGIKESTVPPFKIQITSKELDE